MILHQRFSRNAVLLAIGHHQDGHPPILTADFWIYTLSMLLDMFRLLIQNCLFFYSGPETLPEDVVAGLEE